MTKTFPLLLCVFASLAGMTGCGLAGPSGTILPKAPSSTEFGAKDYSPDIRSLLQRQKVPDVGVISWVQSVSVSQLPNINIACSFTAFVMCNGTSGPLITIGGNYDPMYKRIYNLHKM